MNLYWCETADHEDDWFIVRALGGVFRSETTPRVVQFGNRVYEEGGLDAVLRRLEDDQTEAMGQGRPNGTTKLM